MEEQLDRLKNLVGNKDKQKSKIIAITSGKGGVGKTNIAVNLAIALVQKNQKVLLVDADTNLANDDIILGINPEKSLEDAILGDLTMDDIIIEHESGLKFLPGSSGSRDLITHNAHIMEKFRQQLFNLKNEMDYIILDTAAGLTSMVIDIASSADEIFLVTSPEPTSVTDAYAMTKVLSSINNGHTNIKLLMNMIHEENEANDIYERFTLALDHFLALNVRLLGYIRDDQFVPKAVLEQKPFILTNPNARASRDIFGLADRLLMNGNNGKLEEKNE